MPNAFVAPAARVGVAASIVIVSWRVRELLRDCLQSVIDQTRDPAAPPQIIVVDNDSGDGSAEMVAREFPMVTLVANTENVGFGAANDQVLDDCVGRYVILLNPDTVVLDHALDRLVDHLDAHPDVAVLGSRLLNSDGSLQRWTGGGDPSLWRLACHYLFIDRVLPTWLRPRPLFLDRDVEHDVDVDWVSGACLAVRRDALDGRLFDPAFFMYGEDMELCARMRQRGGRVVYTPTATVVHHHGQSMRHQTGPILLTAFKGPRAYYTMRHGRRMLWLYDLLTAAGFLLRWLAYSLRTLSPGGARFRPRAASSRAYFSRALQVMAGR